MLAGCGRSAKEAPFQPRQFPFNDVPTMIQNPDEVREYIVEHYWDAFTDTAKIYPSDSAMINGVRKDDIGQAVISYVTMLESDFPLDFQKKCVGNLFDQIVKFQVRDTSCGMLEYVTEKIAKLLYDPNSPYRDEDIYLPYLQRMLASPIVPEDMRPSYEYTAKMCSLNQKGTPAADFTFTDLRGHRHSLYDIKADHTLLFFSNPGCPDCERIINSISANKHINSLIASHRLAVVNIYIDLEIDKWKGYASHYPSSWYSGYDQDYKIRQDVSYNVRAIPSLYVLDKDKKVMLKDAPDTKVFEYLNTLN